MTSLGQSHSRSSRCARRVEARDWGVARMADSFPGADTVALHRSPSSPSKLAGVLDRRTMLDVSRAVDGALLQPGHVLTIPAGKHLLVGVDDRVRVDMPFAASALDSPSAALSPPDLADELQQLTAGVVG